MANKKQSNKKKEQLNSYVKYSGMAIQMGLIIGIGSWLGVWLDKQVLIDFPLFTIVLSLTSVILSIYIVLREFIQK